LWWYEEQRQKEEAEEAAAKKRAASEVGACVMVYFMHSCHSGFYYAKICVNVYGDMEEQRQKEEAEKAAAKKKRAASEVGAFVMVNIMHSCHSGF
jgi:ribosomal protein S21